jgi:hypothetical protein
MSRTYYSRVSVGSVVVASSSAGVEVAVSITVSSLISSEVSEVEVETGTTEGVRGIFSIEFDFSGAENTKKPAKIKRSTTSMAGIRYPFVVCISITSLLYSFVTRGQNLQKDISPPQGLYF